jgi:hypothetical protein
VSTDLVNPSHALEHSTASVPILNAMAAEPDVVSYESPIGHARLSTQSIAALDLVQLVGSPPVNAEFGDVRIMPDVSALRQLVTAGGSQSITEPPNAWRLYPADTNALVRNFSRSPTELEGVLTGIGATGGSSREALRSRVVFAFKSGEGQPSEVKTITIDTPEFAPGGLVEQITRLRPVFNVKPMTEYGVARRHAAGAREAALADIRRRLDRAKATYAHMAPREVVTELSDDFGVGQLVTARAAGVTPTAVRKWRRGEPARPEHRDRLSGLAALCRRLVEADVHDPAGWIDIPISGESTLTPLDLFAGGRSDLVVLLGSGLSDPQETLDAFNAKWRTVFAPDHDYEVVTLADGSRSVVPRREAVG